MLVASPAQLAFDRRLAVPQLLLNRSRGRRARIGCSTVCDPMAKPRRSMSRTSSQVRKSCSSWRVSFIRHSPPPRSDFQVGLPYVILQRLAESLDSLRHRRPVGRLRWQRDGRPILRHRQARLLPLQHALLDLVGPQEPARPNVARRHMKHRGNAVSLKFRNCVSQVVAKTIVEGDQQRPWRQRTLCRRGIAQRVPRRSVENTDEQPVAVPGTGLP